MHACEAFLSFVISILSITLYLSLLVLDSCCFLPQPVVLDLFAWIYLPLLYPSLFNSALFTPINTSAHGSSRASRVFCFTHTTSHRTIMWPYGQNKAKTCDHTAKTKPKPGHFRQFRNPGQDMFRQKNEILSPQHSIIWIHYLMEIWYSNSHISSLQTCNVKCTICLEILSFNELCF